MSLFIVTFDKLDCDKNLQAISFFDIYFILHFFIEGKREKTYCKLRCCARVGKAIPGSSRACAKRGPVYQHYGLDVTSRCANLRWRRDRGRETVRVKEREREGKTAWRAFVKSNDTNRIEW